MGSVTGRIFDSDARKFIGGRIEFENGIITDVEKCDCGGDLIVPGFVDVHTHGRACLDFLTADADGLERLKKSYAGVGVTTVVPTLASGTLDEMLAATERIAKAGFRAVHIEGRYLSPSKRGAHNADLIAPLDPAEIMLFKNAAGDMKVHITAAYELGNEFFTKAKSLGITTGLGHSSATFGEADALAKDGLTSFTHLFNAMTSFHHREGGIPAAALLSDCFCEIICDGFHLAPETVRLVNRIKNENKVVLITDSMEGTGCPDGTYSIAGLPVSVSDGKAYTVEGAIAGSTLSMPDAVKNYASFCGIPYEDALICATKNPAEMLGFGNIGRIAVGCTAEFAVLDDNFDVKDTVCG